MGRVSTLLMSATAEKGRGHPPCVCYPSPLVKVSKLLFTQMAFPGLEL
jgi:hypothetical protein